MTKFSTVLGMKSLHRLSKKFKEKEEGNPKELTLDFLLCADNAERNNFDGHSATLEPRVGDQEDASEVNDFVENVEGKCVE